MNQNLTNYCYGLPFLTGRAFIFPTEMPPPERQHSEGATYVNIPISPTSKKQLHYMELELQEQASGTWGAGTQTPSQSKEASILASCSAHKVICVKDTFICSTHYYDLKYLQPIFFMSTYIFSPKYQFQITKQI